MYSLGLNNPPRIGFTLLKSRIKTKRRREQGVCRCKMAGTGFHSCGKPRSNVYHGLRQTAVFRPLIAKKKIFVLRIATAKILYLRADCQGVISVVANRGTFESGLSRGYSCLGKPRYFPSLLCYKFLPRDSPGVRPLRGELFRPKLHKNGLS
jgi:hypothetical protein